jgi:proteasome beta subunit
MDVLKTGTTTVGIVTKDAIIMAADKRVTAGSMIMDKNITKVMPINERMLLTIAGVVSDIQLLVKYIKAEIKIKDLKTGTPTSVKAASNLLAGFNYGGLRSQGSIAQFLLAGTDLDGPQLFEVTFDGAVMPIESYKVTGSGTPFALAVVDSQWKPGMTEAEGIALAKRALTGAMERDSASGNGYDVYVVSKSGVQHKETVNFKTPMQL